MTGSIVARAGDISGTGGLGRFIAMIGAGKDVGGDIAETTHTILLTSVAINTVIGILLCLSGPYVLKIAPPSDMRRPQQITPHNHCKKLGFRK